jgi:hypothetical protein
MWGRYYCQAVIVAGKLWCKFEQRSNVATTFATTLQPSTRSTYLAPWASSATSHRDPVVTLSRVYQPATHAHVMLWWFASALHRVSHFGASNGATACATCTAQNCLPAVVK